MITKMHFYLKVINNSRETRRDSWKCEDVNDSLIEVIDNKH